MNKALMTAWWLFGRIAVIGAALAFVVFIVSEVIAYWPDSAWVIGILVLGILAITSPVHRP